MVTTPQETATGSSRHESYPERDITQITRGGKEVEKLGQTGRAAPHRGGLPSVTVSGMLESRDRVSEGLQLVSHCCYSSGKLVDFFF